MKKVLFIATVVRKHINVFHLPALKMFRQAGYTTYVAAANDTEQQVTIEHCDRYTEIQFKRNPLHPGNLPAYFRLKKLIAQEDFDIIHCHTPVGGVLGRLAARKARKKGTKVFYTAHGFHFFRGAPLKNWLLYFPVERLCAHFTDVLITINQEDYALAKKKMRAKQVEYVPGVGIDLERFDGATVDRQAKRRELGIPENAVVLLSVGEINENKNHQVILRAMALRQEPDLHYVIAGMGEQDQMLLCLARKLGLGDRLHLLGFRSDIKELCQAADIFCFPSRREGLGQASIEAMSCGLPLLTSNIHGINDYSRDGVTGYKCDPNDVNAFADRLGALIADPVLREEMGSRNRQLARRYDVKNICSIMRRLYGIGQE